MPSSTKYSSYDNMITRKKMFTGKTINNENISHVNINVKNSEPQSQKYVVIKNKIDNLEGRLHEIKRNIETSFHGKPKTIQNYQKINSK